MVDLSVVLRTGTFDIAPMKKLPVGNFGDFINFSVQDSDGDPVNITGMTPKFTLYRPGAQHGMMLVWQKDTSIVSGSGGTCRYQVLNGDFTEFRDYFGRIDLYTGTTKIDSTQEFILSVV